jgi:hypothetical protein
MIDNCYFAGFDTRCIYSYFGGYSTVQNCEFIIDGLAGIGIEHITNGTSRPYFTVRNNLFTTTDATNAYGIKLTNTPTAGYFIVADNRFGGNFADEGHCISTKAGYLYGQNWYGSTIIAYS